MFVTKKKFSLSGSSNFNCKLIAEEILKWYCEEEEEREERKMAKYWISFLFIVGISILPKVASILNQKHQNNSHPLKLTLINSSGFNRHPWWQMTTERSAVTFSTLASNPFTWNNAVETTTTPSPSTQSPHRSHRSGHHHKSHIR